MWTTIVVVPAIALLCGCSGGGDGEAAAVDASSAKTAVTVAPAVRRVFEDRVLVQGTLEAKSFALVSPLVPGRIDTIHIEEGDAVVAGKTELFQVDRVKLTKSVVVADQALAMARSAKESAQAQVARVETDVRKAQLDFKRYKKLEKQGAVTGDALEIQQARFEQASAALRHAEALDRQAAEQVRQAEASLAIAKKDLADSVVVAPINGRVSAKLREVGEYAGVGEAVLRIDDPSVLEVSAFLPGEHYPRAQVGTTPVRVSVYGVDLGEAVLSYKSPTIDPQLRTFEAKCLLTTPPDSVAPGAMADLAFVFQKREGLGVPTGALQARGDSDVVFVAQDGRARMVPVTTGLTNDGWTEVEGEGVSEGTQVVTQGQYMLEDGAAVAVDMKG